MVVPTTSDRLLIPNAAAWTALGSARVVTVRQARTNAYVDDASEWDRRSCRRH